MKKLKKNSCCFMLFSKKKHLLYCFLSLVLLWLIPCIAVAANSSASIHEIIHNLQTSLTNIPLTNSLFLVVLTAAMFIISALLFRKENPDNPLTFDNAFISERGIASKIVYNLSLFLVISLIPIILFIAINGTEGGLLIAILVEVLFMIAFVVVKRYSYLTIALICLILYPLLAVTPLFFDCPYSILFVIVVTFGIVAILSDNYIVQILNGLLAIVSFVSFSILFHQLIKQPFDRTFIGNLLIGFLAMFFTFLNVVLYKRTFKQNQEKLTHSHHFLQQISDLNPHFIYAKDTNRKFTFVSKSFKDAFGITNKNEIGLTREELFGNADTSEIAKQEDHDVLLKGLRKHIPEKRAFDKNKELRILEAIKIPMYNSKKEIIGLLGIATDITERKNTILALERSEKRYRTIFENNQFGLLMAKKGRISDCNEAFCNMTGYSRTELIGNSVNMVMHPEDYDATSAMVEETINSSMHGIRLEHRFVRKDGRIGYAIINLKEAPSKSGEMRETIGTIADITMLKEAEKAIKASEIKYKTLFNDSPLGCLIVDTEHQKLPLECNEKWLQLTRRTKEEALQENMLTTSPVMQSANESSKEKLAAIMKAYRTNWEHISFQWKFMDAAQTSFWSEVTFTPIIIQEKKLTLIQVRDISQQKQTEELIRNNLKTLNQKNDELRKYIESNMQLENFAYLASHDLKAPVRSIVGFSQLLHASAKDKLNEEERDYLKFIIDSTKNMSSLIKDLLTYSRVDSANQKIIPVNIKETVQLVIHEMQANIKEKNATINISNLPTQLNSDFTQIRQLFQNLIANAIKFSRKNVSPIVNITAEERSDDWLFNVSDNGIGIAPEYHEQIFLLFRRLNNRLQYEGSGMGLAICARIIDLHGGEIDLNSTKGVGTTFYFTINKSLKNPIKVDQK